MYELYYLMETYGVKLVVETIKDSKGLDCVIFTFVGKNMVNGEEPPHVSDVFYLDRCESDSDWVIVHLLDLLDDFIDKHLVH